MPPRGCATRHEADTVSSAVFECRCRLHGDDAAWIDVQGELDIAAASSFATLLRAAMQQARLVVLDLRPVTFMDGAGVHAITEASELSRKRGGRLVVLRGPDHVHQAFALSGTPVSLEVLDLAV